MNRAYKNTKHYRGAQSQKQNSECRVLVMVYTLEKKKKSRTGQSFAPGNRVPLIPMHCHCARPVLWGHNTNISWPCEPLWRWLEITFLLVVSFPSVQSVSSGTTNG